MFRKYQIYEDTFRIIRKKCIGCGVCVTTCPTEAIRLVGKERKQRIDPHEDEDARLEERARQKGMDFSGYK